MSEPASSPEVRADTKFAASAAALPLMTPQRLALLLRNRPAEQVWDDIRAGRAWVREALSSMRSFARGAAPSPGGSVMSAPEVAATWASAAQSADVEAGWRSLTERGIAAVRIGEYAYPKRLLGDDEAPEVLFVRGDLACAENAAAAIVGTRRATHYGGEIAAELGAGLARAGVCVVSGLATGIDTAAHEGALAGATSLSPGPLGVLGGGVDVYYPSRNRRLIDRVASAGAVISEAPPGATPDPWRFPLRNRIIAALAQVVVIVESPRNGGAMHTVEAALRRGREVFAVPGSVRSPTSEGTNELLSAGAHVARDAEDLLVEIEQVCVSEGVAVPRGCIRPARTEGGAGRPAEHEAADLSRSCSDDELRMLAALDEHPRPIDTVCQRTGLGLAAASLALDRLMELRLASPTDGAWRRT